MTKSTLDRLRSVVESERLGQTVLDLLGGLYDVREAAYALTELADNIESAESDIQDYLDAEGREEKAGAKEEALSALQSVIQAWEAVEALTSVDRIVTPP